MAAVQQCEGKITDTSDDRLVLLKIRTTGDAFVVRLGDFENYHGTSAVEAGIVSGRDVVMTMDPARNRVLSVKLK